MTMADAERTLLEDGDGRCAVSTCGARLGKRFMNPRHHCRLCQSLVCGACSPSFLTLDGQAGTHRACTPCVTQASKIPEIQDRLTKFVQAFRTAVDVFTSSTGEGQSSMQSTNTQNSQRSPLESPGGRYSARMLADAVLACESLTIPLEALRSGHDEVQAALSREREDRARQQRRADEVEANLARERSERQRLQHLCDETQATLARERDDHIRLQTLKDECETALERANANLSTIVDSSFRFGDRVYGVAEVFGPSRTDHDRPESAVAYCEAALCALELASSQRATDAKNERDRLQAKIDSSRASCVKLSRRLQAMHDGALLFAAPTTDISLEEAITRCEESVIPLELLVNDITSDAGAAGARTPAMRGETLSPCSAPNGHDDWSPSSVSPRLGRSADLNTVTVVESLVVEDDWTCTVCGVRLGKSRLKPRHHCRLCNRACCGPCCRLTRVCAPCIGGCRTQPTTPID